MYNNYGHNPRLTPLARTLRKNMTREEKHLWYDFLSTYPVRFLKQKVIDNYIVDFYCASAKLVIELDGIQHSHYENFIKDNIRTEKLEKYNLCVIRIPNKYINSYFPQVCEYIDEVVKNRTCENM